MNKTAFSSCFLWNGFLKHAVKFLAAIFFSQNRFHCTFYSNYFKYLLRNGLTINYTNLFLKKK